MGREHAEHVGWDFSAHMRAEASQMVVSDGLLHTPLAVSRVRGGERPDGGLTEAYAPHEAYLVVLRLSAYRVPQMWVDGKAVRHNALSAGTLSIYDLDRLWFADMREPFDCLQFHVPQQALRVLAEETGVRAVPRLFCPPEHSGVDEVVHRLGRVLVPAIARPGESSRLFIEHLTIAFHAHLLSRYGSPGAASAPRARAPRGLGARQLQRAVDFFREHLDQDIALDAVARECGLSRSYFIKAFKQSTGLPPYQWVLAQRLARAKQLMRANAMPLAEVAAACGFSDQSHFTRTFSRMEGVSPAVWKKAR